MDAKPPKIAVLQIPWFFSEIFRRRRDKMHFIVCPRFGKGRMRNQFVKQLISDDRMRIVRQTLTKHSHSKTEFAYRIWPKRRMILIVTEPPNEVLFRPRCSVYEQDLPCEWTRGQDIKPTVAEQGTYT